jgi:hypothetical protein
MPTITIWILAYMATAETTAFAIRLLLRSEIGHPASQRLTRGD